MYTASNNAAVLVSMHMFWSDVNKYTRNKNWTPIKIICPLFETIKTPSCKHVVIKQTCFPSKGFNWTFTKTASFRRTILTTNMLVRTGRIDGVWRGPVGAWPASGGYGTYGGTTLDLKRDFRVFWFSIDTQVLVNLFPDISITKDIKFFFLKRKINSN